MKENTTFAGVNNGFGGFVMSRLWTFAAIVFFLFAGGYVRAGEGAGGPDFSQTFSFNPYPDSQGMLVNDILHTIAEGSGKLRVYTNYTFRGRLQADIVPGTGERHRLIVIPDTMYVTGDVTYRDFSLAGILIPDRAAFLLEVHDAEEKEVYSHFFEDVDLTAAPDQWGEVSLSYDGSTDDLSIQLSGYQFRYDGRMRERLNLWGAALETYYEAGEKLRRVEELKDGLAADNPETLLLEEFRLCEAEALLGDIHHAPFQQWLDLHQHDPENIMPDYERLRRELILLREDFNQAVSRIDDLYYQHGEKIARSESPEDARDAYESALNYNPLHIPSHLALADLDKNSGDKEAALERLGIIFNKGHPSGKWRQKADLMADTLLGMFFKASSEMIYEDRLTSSLNNLAHVQVFCRLVEGNYPCPGELHHMLVQTHHGIYRSFLVVSGRAIRDDNLDLATTYIQNAIEYQQMHPGYVRCSEEAYELLFRAMTRYRILSSISFLINEVNGCGEYLSKVRDIARKHPEMFDLVSGAGNPQMLKTGALNYAAAGQPHRSIHLLKELESRGIASEETAYLQRQAGVAAAVYFRNEQEEGKEPGSLVDELTGGNPWFRHFRESFLENW